MPTNLKSVLNCCMARLQILLDDNCIKLIKLAAVHYNTSLTTMADDALKIYITEKLMNDDEFFQLVNSSNFDAGSNTALNIEKVRKLRKEKNA